MQAAQRRVPRLCTQGRAEGAIVFRARSGRPFRVAGHDSAYRVVAPRMRKPGATSLYSGSCRKCDRFPRKIRSAVPCRRARPGVPSRGTQPSSQCRVPRVCTQGRAGSAIVFRARSDRPFRVTGHDPAYRVVAPSRPLSAVIDGDEQGWPSQRRPQSPSAPARDSARARSRLRTNRLSLRPGRPQTCCSAWRAPADR